MESVVNDRQYNNKVNAERKASQPLNPNVHLQPIYIDSHIVVVNKESGVLSVPGPRRNPSVGGLVHEYIGNDDDDVDSMIVHRLDMDTSGIICFARNKHVLGVLHEAFRNKSKNGVGSGDETVYKKYEALVCGHMLSAEGEIDLPLVRDQNRPPFMKVFSDFNNIQRLDTTDCDFSIETHSGYIKMMSKAPKESLSLFRVLAWEYLEGLPVTRLELIPITGRTHQLRVHCAAIGHPIVGDSIYGYNGDGSQNGGLSHDASSIFQSRASETDQRRLYDLVQTKQECSKTGEYNGNMCLHAKQLCFFHPITRAPMSFETDAPF
jgi:23S rRNA-/tRNA-specific pseudouridylate synthase